MGASDTIVPQLERLGPRRLSIMLAALQCAVDSTEAVIVSKLQPNGVPIPREGTPVRRLREQQQRYRDVKLEVQAALRFVDSKSNPRQAIPTHG